jgi:hypothetical protein
LAYAPGAGCSARRSTSGGSNRRCPCRQPARK